MKLYNIKHLRLLFTILILASFSLLEAQTLSQSPYGRFGLGDQQYTPSPYLQALGGASQAIADSNILNLNQPAALASLEGGVTIFEAGLNGTSTTYTFADRTSLGRTAGFGYFGLAFPIVKRKWNMAFALTPLSNVGYTLRDTIADDVSGDIFLSYEGQGGYSSFSWTNGFKLGKNFSLGVQARYLFGRVDYSSRVLFSGGLGNGDKNSLITRSNRMGGLDFETGFMYRKYFRRKKPSETQGKEVKPQSADSLHLTFGGTFKPFTAVDGSFTYLAQSFFGNNPSIPNSFTDTISLEDKTPGAFDFPMQYGGGVTLSNSSDKWMITAEMVYTDWDKFKIFNLRDSVRSSYRAALGLQINPSPVTAGLKSSYFKKIRYRVGGFYSDGMLSINGEAVPEYGVSLGFGLPVLLRTYNTRPAVSILNFAVGYGRRGLRGVNPLIEDYIRVSLSFSLNDRWFRKLQYD
ncbi:MAG: hypothetical protein WED33_07940 [Bacteroidia bacterium]